MRIVPFTAVYRLYSVIVPLFYLLKLTSAAEQEFSNDIVDAANFAVDKLRQLSHSDVYQTISLQKILTGTVTEGIFHRKHILLEVLLSSPVFASGDEAERFQILVMEEEEEARIGYNEDEKRVHRPDEEEREHKCSNASSTTETTGSTDTRKRSFAIDRFPSMDETAIESWWIRKIERRRRDNHAVVYSRFLPGWRNGSETEETFFDGNGNYDDFGAFRQQKQQRRSGPQIGVQKKQQQSPSSSLLTKRLDTNDKEAKMKQQQDQYDRLAEEAVREREEERLLKRQSLAQLSSIINNDEGVGNDALRRKVAKRLFDGRFLAVTTIARGY